MNFGVLKRDSNSSVLNWKGLFSLFRSLFKPTLFFSPPNSAPFLSQMIRLPFLSLALAFSAVLLVLCDDLPCPTDPSSAPLPPGCPPPPADGKKAPADGPKDGGNKGRKKRDNILRAKREDKSKDSEQKADDEADCAPPNGTPPPGAPPPGTPPPGASPPCRRQRGGPAGGGGAGGAAQHPPNGPPPPPPTTPKP